MAQRLARPIDLLVIGGSAGSLDVLMQLLPALRPDLELAIIIVLHRKPGESVLSELFGDRMQWTVKEAEEKEAVKAGHVYLAPADYHLLVERDKTLSLDFSEKLHYSRPAIDITFDTAAEAYGASLAAMLLSGANADGAAGLQTVRSYGGYAMVQEPGNAAVAYMPQQALAAGPVDFTGNVAALIAEVNSWKINSAESGTGGW